MKWPSGKAACGGLGVSPSNAIVCAAALRCQVERERGASGSKAVKAHAPSFRSAHGRSHTGLFKYTNDRSDVGAVMGCTSLSLRRPEWGHRR